MKRTCNQTNGIVLCDLEEGHPGAHQAGGGGDDDRGLTWPNISAMTIAQCIDDACREVIGPEFTSAIRSPSQKLRALMEHCFMRRLNYGALSELVRAGMSCLEQQMFLTTYYEKPAHGWCARPRLERDDNNYHRIVVGNHASEWEGYRRFAKLTVDGRTYVACHEYYNETFPEEKVFIVEELSP